MKFWQMVFIAVATLFVVAIAGCESFSEALRERLPPRPIRSKGREMSSNKKLFLQRSKDVQQQSKGRPTLFECDEPVKMMR